MEEFPGKEVTLVHSGSYLMNRTEGLSRSTADYCEKWLKNHGCKIVLNTRLNSNENTNKFESSEGEKN